MGTSRLRIVQSWRQAVDEALRRIIKEYYQTPRTLRSACLVLKLVEKHWSYVRPDSFDSNVQYYKVLAQTTDYLLRFLSPMIESVLLFEKVGRGVKQVDIDIAYRQKGLCTVRKFIWQEDEAFCSRYMQNVMAAFCEEGGMQLQKIEFCSLFTGKCTIYYIAG